MRARRRPLEERWSLEPWLVSRGVTGGVGAAELRFRVSKTKARRVGERLQQRCKRCRTGHRTNDATPHDPRVSKLSLRTQVSTSAICWDGRLSVEVVGGTISI